MILVDILIVIQGFLQIAEAYLEWGKEWLRNVLGPSRHQVYLLCENDTVIPQYFQHPSWNAQSTYDPKTGHICLVGNADTNAAAITPLKRLPWISVQYALDDHVTDISDWIAGLRTNAPVSLVALLRLAAFAHGTHFPEIARAKVTAIDRFTGEEELLTFHGGRGRLLVPLVQRRSTCPFDIADGAPIY